MRTPRIICCDFLPVLCLQSSVLSKAAMDLNTLSSTHSPTNGPCVISAVASPDCPEVRGTHFLCVDTVESSQILISFSALSHWGDASGDKTKMLHAACRSAVLVVMPCTWKSPQPQYPVLTIKTTCSNAAMLDLPPGRHMLSFCAKATVGYHLHLCSMTPFTFADEETIVSNLPKESALFMDQALSIFRALSRVVSSFNNEQEQIAARRMLAKSHCPQSSTSLRKHDTVFSRAVDHMVCGALGRELTAEERFAVCSLTADPSLLYTEQTEPPPAFSKSRSDRKPTDPVVKAATTLQATDKGRLAPGILNASKPGTKENLSASKILSDMWPKIESCAEENAALLLWYIIDHSGKKANLYGCQQDNWSRLTFADYSVPVPTTADSWVLLYREVFLIPKAMPLAIKVYSPSPHFLLYIVNNDTVEELDMLFNIYQPNKRGYTFVAVAVSPQTPPDGAEWRMRLIGEKNLLPILAHEPPLSTFTAKELQDHYIPNEKSIVCRNSVQVRADVLATVQFQTSKPDVTVRLSILDQEREVISKTGKGHVTIPAFFFLANKDMKVTDGEKQDTSPTQVEGVKVSDASTQGHQDDVTFGAAASPSDRLQPPTEPRDHKYVVRAEVLYKSWQLDEAELTFVQQLRESQRNEMRANEAEDMSSSLDRVKRDGKAAASTKVKAKKGKPVVPPKTEAKAAPQELDVTKPHWTLRLVIDQSSEESIDVAKDTERRDKIKATKKAWEMAEPGRYSKASQCHFKFLNQVQQQLIRKGQEDVDQKTETASRSDSLFDLSSSFPPLDLTPFIRPRKDFPSLERLNAEEVRQGECLQKIQTYRLVREIMLEQQKKQRRKRKEMTRLQMDVYAKMQAARLQEGMRFSEALKRRSPVATDTRTTEKVQKQKPAAGQLPKKHGKKK
uniref:Globin domain-containing protein n=1 Tax=Takifugu rubripes TaxID=31033 RepID=A0A674P1Q5_TAKRU